MELTDKQEIFIREYLITLNATQAAIKAGYSEKTATEQGSRLLTNVKVLARIEELQEKRAEKLELDATWVLKRLQEISDRCMTAEPVMEFNYTTKELEPTGEYKFDSGGANKSTELIGKHLGMFTDKIKLDVNGQVNTIHEYHIEQTITTDPESAELIKQLYKRQAASSVI